MADSPVFDRTCDELESRTPLDRLAVRGTVRIGLKTAGLDVHGVNAAQMGIVLRKVLPAELESRDVADAAAICEAVAEAIAGIQVDASQDRAGAAASTIGRFGG